MALNALEEDVTKAVEKLSRSVASIQSRGLARGGGRFVPLDGSGSGFVVDGNGHVITNNHVVDSADNVQVTLQNGEVFDGRVMGADEATDIAVIQLEDADDENLPYATLGDSQALKVGQFALAIGNSLGLPGGPTVSLGVVSALHRPLPGADFIYEGFIQTDAAVNPGNSGGPLANLQGEVIGINTAIIPYANGVGFAIPINLARYALEQILEQGRVVRPWIGISGVDLNSLISRRYNLPVESGILVIGISRYSPAHEAGLREGDVITRINGAEVKKVSNLLSELSKQKVGAGVRLNVVRMGKFQEASLRLVEMPQTVVNRS
jgi:serine protease Do